MTHSTLAQRTDWTTDRSSRDGRKIDRFIVHHAATTSLAGILALFRPGGRTVSANYALKDRDLVATVPEEYRAWTSSSSSWDGRAVTIEVANSATGGVWPVSDESFDTLARLIADVSRRYGFAITDESVLTHQELYLRYGASYATACPGDMQRRKRELLALAQSYRAGRAPASAPAPAPPPAPAPEPLWKDSDMLPVLVINKIKGHKNENLGWKFSIDGAREPIKKSEWDFWESLGCRTVTVRTDAQWRLIRTEAEGIARRRTA